MDRRVVILTAVSLAASIGATAAFLRVEQRSAMADLENRSGAIARQIASQVEALTWVAKERGEKDPVRWASDQLSQTSVPRAFRVKKAEFPAGEIGTALETTGYLPADRERNGMGQFFLERMILPELGIGVRVELESMPRRPLGARNQLGQDLRTTGFALTIFSLLMIFGWAGIQWFTPSLNNVSPIHIANEAADFRGKVRDWVREFKVVLLQLGTQVKEMIRHCHDIAVAASNTRQVIGSLKNRIHDHLEVIHAERGATRGFSKGATQSEALALNIVLEASRIGEKSAPLGKMAEELHLKIKEMRKNQELLLDLVKTSEVALEPIVTDITQAHASFDEIFKITQSMDQPIRKTSESLLSQAKLIQSANIRIASNDQ